MIRSILAFVAAVLVTYLIAASLATQHVLGALTEMGMDINFGVWAHATLHDLIGMFATFAPLIAVAADRAGCGSATRSASSLPSSRCISS